jgi:hypothetical protein
LQLYECHLSFLENEVVMKKSRPFPGGSLHLILSACLLFAYSAWHKGKPGMKKLFQSNVSIRKISPSGQVTMLAGSFIAGFADGSGATAQFNLPFGIAIDQSGNLYFGGLRNNSLRKISFP